MVIDEGDVFARKFRESDKAMLSRADPYRDLILSPAEMDQFTEEVESLLAGADETEAHRIHQVMELVGRCRGDPSTELHLQGD